MFNLYIKNFFYSTILFFVFIVTIFSVCFIPTTPSDPLQYVSHAISSPPSYPFLDRFLLYVLITLTAKLPLPLEFIGPTVTLAISSLILLLSSIWLKINFGIKSSIYFSALFISSPMIFGISSYTYPTQLLTLLIVISTFVGMSQIPKKFFILGFLYALILFSKVQGMFFIIFPIILILQRKENFLTKILIYISGLILGLFFLYFLGIISNPNFSPFNVIQVYFQNSGDFNSQFSGRGEGAIPPFYKLALNPVFILSIFGILYPLVLSKFSYLRVFSYAALVQFFGLIFIYAVTQRGGPLIFNYLLDVYILGLIPFSIIFTKSFNVKKIYFYIPITILIFLCIFFSFYPIENITVVKQWDINSSYITLLILILFLYYTILDSKFINKNYVYLVFSFIALSNIYYSISDGVARMQWSEPYHLTSKALSNLLDIHNPHVFLRLNANSYSDGTWRLNSVFSTFYTQLNPKIIPNFNSSDSSFSDKSTVITDSPYTFSKLISTSLLKYSQVYEFDAKKGYLNSVIIPVNFSNSTKKDKLFFLHYANRCIVNTFFEIEFIDGFNKKIRKVTYCDSDNGILDIGVRIPILAKSIKVTFNSTQEKLSHHKFEFFILDAVDGNPFPILLLSKGENVKYLDKSGSFKLPYN